VYGTDVLQRVAEGADSVEDDVLVDGRLIEDSNAARLGVTARRIGLVYDLVENA